MASILGFFSVSPACAGMILIALLLYRADVGEPRMRGDDPGVKIRTLKAIK